MIRKEIYTWLTLSILLVCCHSNPQTSDVNSKKYTIAATNAKNEMTNKFELMNGTNFNFGNVKAGSIVTHAFYYKNVSSSPLVIESVVTPCGCTVAHYNKQALLPNRIDSIITIFHASANMLGTQNKTVTVNYNAPSSPKLLTLYGKVVN